MALDLERRFSGGSADLPEQPPLPATARAAHCSATISDTLEGLLQSAWSSLFLPIEEKVGAVSSNYIVPCAWTIDHALLAEVRDRGHEIGIHGYDHSNRTPFATPDEMLRRLSAARPLIERYGIIGYRAPSLLRTVALVEAIGGMYRYDSSILTSEGCCLGPQQWLCHRSAVTGLKAGRCQRSPRHCRAMAACVSSGMTLQEIAAVWRACAERIAASGGIVSLLTHCERSVQRHRHNAGCLPALSGLPGR